MLEATFYCCFYWTAFKFVVDLKNVGVLQCLMSIRIWGALGPGSPQRRTLSAELPWRTKGLRERCGLVTEWTSTQNWGQNLGTILSLTEWACIIFFFSLCFSKCFCGMILPETCFLCYKGLWGRRQTALTYLELLDMTEIPPRGHDMAGPLTHLRSAHKTQHWCGFTVHCRNGTLCPNL